MSWHQFPISTTVDLSWPQFHIVMSTAMSYVITSVHHCHAHCCVLYACLFHLRFFPTVFQSYRVVSWRVTPVLDYLPQCLTTKTSPGEQTHAREVTGLEVIDLSPRPRRRFTAMSWCQFPNNTPTALSWHQFPISMPTAVMTSFTYISSRLSSCLKS
jgi:hypothetical protein